MTEVTAEDHAIIGLNQWHRQNLLEEGPGLEAGKLDMTVVQAVFSSEAYPVSE